MSNHLSSWKNKLAPWAVPVAILALWELSARAGWLSTRVLPEPLAVIKAFWVLAKSGELWQHVATSTWRALLSFAIGGGLGLLLGLLTGTVRTAETLLGTTLQMIRNIPALAMIPLVILWFGIDETAKLFLVALGYRRDERARVLADRCGAGGLMYALLGKLADVAAKELEQWWLRWHPGYQAGAQVAVA